MILLFMLRGSGLIPGQALTFVKIVDHGILSAVILLHPLTTKGSFSYWRKFWHLLQLNRLVGVSLPKYSVVRLTQ